MAERRSKRSGTIVLPLVHSINSTLSNPGGNGVMCEKNGSTSGVRGWLEAVLLFQSSGERGRAGIASVSFGSDVHGEFFPA